MSKTSKRDSRVADALAGRLRSWMVETCAEAIPCPFEGCSPDDAARISNDVITRLSQSQGALANPARFALSSFRLGEVIGRHFGHQDGCHDVKLLGCGNIDEAALNWAAGHLASRVAEWLSDGKDEPFPCPYYGRTHAQMDEMNEQVFVCLANRLDGDALSRAIFYVGQLSDHHLKQHTDECDTVKFGTVGLGVS